MMEFLYTLQLHKKVERKDTQSYIGTKTCPSSDPTSCAIFTPVTVDEFTQPTISSKHDTRVRRNVCLNKPKHQSGANLVCPVRKKEIVIEVWRPSKTRQHKYHNMAEFFF